MTRSEVLEIAKPMLFNTEMTRAIKDNLKTVTRRLVKGYALNHMELDTDGSIIGIYNQDEGQVLKVTEYAPYRPGDILYVPEAWRCTERCTSNFYEIEFQDGEKTRVSFTNESRRQKWLKYIDKPRDHWQSPYFMPREAARIFLRVTNVQVERLQEITEDDVVAEGAEPLILCLQEHGTIEPDGSLGDMCWNTNCCGHCMYIEKSYGELFGEMVWNSTIKPADRSIYGWDANPWVWVIGFEKMEADNETDRCG